MNLANGDMVGHTGDLDATIIGCAAVDDAVKVKLNLICPCYVSELAVLCNITILMHWLRKCF